MSHKPIRIAILALGGQGGGVLSRWIVTLAESQGWIAQATSVPGVAQRTGSTVYYVEMARQGDIPPVMALMPASGDVDIVIAAEFMEAGRALARGWVTSDRTTMVASSHRIYSIGEKSVPGDGRFSSASILDAVQAASRQLVLADWSAIAAEARAPISSALFGALAGSGALPFEHETFIEAIEQSGMSSPANLAAFAEAARIASHDQPSLVTNLANSADNSDQNAADGTLPAPIIPLYQLGLERIRDYQGERLVPLYQERIEEFLRADRELGGENHGFALTASACRYLALWMTYEDVFRVADLKTRPGRLKRISEEHSLTDGHVVHVTEFMHPRYEEICDSLPRRLGSFMRDSTRAKRMLAPFLQNGRFIRTTGVFGFSLLWVIAFAGRWRKGTLRWFDEQQRIEAWLGSALNAARDNYDLGVGNFAAAAPGQGVWRYPRAGVGQVSCGD